MRFPGITLADVVVIASPTAERAVAIHVAQRTAATLGTTIDALPSHQLWVRKHDTPALSLPPLPLHKLKSPLAERTLMAATTAAASGSASARLPTRPEVIL